MNLEKYFLQFRRNIVGNQTNISFSVRNKKDYLCRLDCQRKTILPIEEKIRNVFGPFVGNTHTETNITGTMMTQAYHYAHEVIKRHVNADPKDALLNVGFGMTSALIKLQRMLGLKYPDQLEQFVSIPSEKNRLFL